MDPYLPPDAPVSPRSLRGGRPVFCWLVLALGLFGVVGVAWTLYDTNNRLPGFVGNYLATPGARLKLMMPVLYLFGAVMFFQLRKVALVALALHLLCVLPLNLAVLAGEPTRLMMALTVLNLGFMAGTLAYGVHLWKQGRLR